MKILDLLEKDIPRIERTATSVKPSKRHKVLGQGTQGMAQEHSRSPNTVIKYSNIYDENPERDEYVQFIKLILDHQDNPFFPRIYKAKIVYDNKQDIYVLIATMEKLVKLTNPKIRDTAEHLIAQLGIDIDDAVIRDESDAHDLKWLFDWFRDSDNRKRVAQESNNPQFVEAMTLLEPYFVKYGQDMHRGNIMVRLTGHGPQLVIIDPYQFRG